jgi:molybdate transport system substrate-binding protein
MRVGLCLWRVTITLLIFSPALSVDAAEIRIVASPSVSAVVRELGPRFESATGHKLSVRYGLIAAQKQQIEAGDFDLAITPSAVVDYEIAQGKIRPQTRTEVARAGLGVGIREGATKPDLATIDSFKQVLLGARSLSYVANEPSGMQIGKDFESLGIGEAVKAKIKSQVSVRDVWKAVANGNAELGFGFVPNALSAPGIEFAGSFPASLQFYTAVAAAVGVTAQQPDAAEAFIKYLIGPVADPVIKKAGFEPAKP